MYSRPQYPGPKQNQFFVETQKLSQKSFKFFHWLNKFSVPRLEALRFGGYFRIWGLRGLGFRVLGLGSRELWGLPGLEPCMQVSALRHLTSMMLGLNVQVFDVGLLSSSRDEAKVPQAKCQ